MGAEKWILPTALVSSIGYITGRNIAQDADRLDAVIVPAIHAMDLEGIKLRVNVKLKNPTKRSFDFSQPFVEIKYNGSTLGSSQASDKVTTFPAGGENSFEPIMITIPWTNLLFLGWQVVKDLKSGTVGMVCEARATSYTTIFLVYRKQVTYSKEIHIRKEQQQ